MDKTKYLVNQFPNRILDLRMYPSVHKYIDNTDSIVLVTKHHEEIV